MRSATLILIFLFVVIVYYGLRQQEDRLYTVRFVNGTDTTYLLNKEPLTLKEARDIARKYEARPVLFEEKCK